MSENLFENCFTSKKSNIKVKTIQKYALKCDKITYWCDEMKLISKGAFLENCGAFALVQKNYTNSKDVSLDVEKFRNCVFDSISVSLDIFDSCLLYKVYVVYEWKPYNLIDFRFFDLNSKTAKQNQYLSDILIHWKAWRLQVVSGWKFNIYDFLIQFVWYGHNNVSKYITALNEYYITRFDFRIDFFHENNIKHLSYNDVFSQTARKNIDNLVIDRHSKKLYTWWTAWNRKDKYIYTRMYQKQIESLDKWHWELYIDYLEYPWKVWRLEFEFLSKFTTARKKITLNEEYFNHTLTKQVFEYIWLSEKNWYFSKPKNKIEIPFDKLTAYQKKRYITQLKNNVIKVYKGGINPYTIVNEAIKEYHPWTDRQIIEDIFNDSIFWTVNYEDIMKNIENSKISTKDYYDRFLKSQLWIDQ